MNGFAPDGRWFGAVPETIVAVDGDNANRLIPTIQHVIENYKLRSLGDYSAWPGPNSNTFVQAVLGAVPELKAVLPPTAIGKDYPYEGEWLGLTPSRTGIYASLGGYLGLTVGWVEGIELNFFGAVLGSMFVDQHSNCPALAGWAYQSHSDPPVFVVAEYRWRSKHFAAEPARPSIDHRGVGGGDDHRIGTFGQGIDEDAGGLAEYTSSLLPKPGYDGERLLQSAGALPGRAHDIRHRCGALLSAPA